jgi:ABC-type phosphate transport system substrate-binding protein
MFAAPAASAEPAGYKVIVNAARPGRALRRAVLAQVYLGEAQRWGDGRPIVAVDLSSTSKVRTAFTASVLEMPTIRVQQHWLRAVAGGKVPPRTKETDEDVIAFVAREAGGIGYVSEDAALPPSVRAVAIE